MNSELATKNNAELNAIFNEQNWMQLFMNRTEGQRLADLFFAGVKYLVITELIIAPCLLRCLLWCIRCHAVGFIPFQQAHSKNPPPALLFLPNHIVQYQSNSIITRTVSKEQPGYYGILQCAQEAFCIRPRGITLIESTQIRWFRDDQAEDAGLVEP